MCSKKMVSGTFCGHYGLMHFNGNTNRNSYEVVDSKWTPKLRIFLHIWRNVGDIGDIGVKNRLLNWSVTKYMLDAEWNKFGDIWWKHWLS